MNWLPFQGAGGGFELIEFWQRGRGAAPQFDVGLRRRNNELNELTNCRAAEARRFRINRIFAVRYIRAGLRGLKAQQVRSPGQRPGLTYVPHLRPVRAKVINNRCAHTFALTGRRALFLGTQGVALGCELAALSGRSRRFRINRIFAVRYMRAALRGLKAQQVRSPGQRPGLTYVPPLRPVRAKVINNRCAHTFALTGRRALYPGTQGVALGWELAALSGRSRRNSLSAPARPRNSLIRVIRCYAV